MLKELFRQSSWFFVGYGAGAFLSLVAFPLWTRYFSIEEYGIMSLIAAVVTFIGPISRAGLNKAVLRFFSEFRASQSSHQMAGFYTTFFVGSLVSGMLTGLIFLGVILLLGPERLGGTHVQILFILSAIGVALGPASTIYAPFMRVEEKSKQFVVMRIFRTFSQFGLRVLLVLVLLFGLKGMYIAGLMMDVFMLALIVFLLRRQKKLIFSAFSLGLLFEALRFGVPLIAAQLANHISNIGDRFVIQFLLGTEAVGLYAVGYGLTSQLKSAVTIIMFVVTPMYVKIWQEEGREKTEEFLTSVLDYYLMFAIPGIILLSFFGGDILVLMASSKYNEARILIPYLAPPLVLHGAISIYTAGMFIYKKTKFILYFTVSSGALNVILNLILIPFMGIVGAAVATLISYIFLIACANILSSKYIKIQLNYLGIIRYMAASFLAVIFLRFINIELFFGIIVKLLIGILIYLSAMWALDIRVRQKIRMALHKL